MSANKLISLLLIATSCFLHKAACQPVVSEAFKTLNVANGLPQSFISGLVQDSTGFIWIGTRDGLARYDGRSFKVFRHIPGDTTTLADNIVSSLYLDKHGRLWISYEAGDIDVLNTATEALYHFTQDRLFKPVYANLKEGPSIAEDGQGNLWMFCSNGGIYVCNPAKRMLRFHPAKDFGLQINKIAAITVDSGHIVLVTDKALVVVSEDQKVVQVSPYTFPNPRIENLDLDWKVTPTIYRRNGDLVINDQTRLIVYKPSSHSFTVVDMPEHAQALNYCITQDDKGQVFFDYNYTVYMLSPDNKLSVWKPRENNPPFGFKSILVDRSGVLWLGGNGSGIQLCDLRLSRLTGLPYKINFHEDILLSFLNVPEKEIQQTAMYNISPYMLRWTKGSDNDIWLAGAGVFAVKQPDVYYYKNGHLITPAWHYTDTSDKQHVRINSLAVSPSGKLWGIDFYLHPVYFDTTTHAVTVYPQIASINFNYTYTVSSLWIDKDEKFWISTALSGLFCYDKQKHQTIHYQASEVPGTLPTNQLMNIVEDPTSPAILWIGSMGGGLIKFNKNTGKCHIYTTREGLPNNTVYAVVKDSRGMLWCSSNKGIFLFDPKKEVVIRSFTSKDGLPADEFNRYHFLELPDGRIAFGGIDGYTVFNPLAITTDNFQPQVALTGIRVNNLPADYGVPHAPFKQAINSLSTVTLDYNHNFLSFEFAAPEYNIPEKLQYRYMLEGFDKDWVYAGNDNIATYTKIPPGHYVLKVNASNTTGQWSPYVRSLNITIEPPFWLTWWFITLCALAVAGVIYLLLRFRINIIRKEERQKMEFEREASELKAQALRAQMNPHFIFNCLNSIKALIHEDNKRQAISYLTTFSKLIRSQLNNAQQEVSLHDELETCRLYAELEALRFGSKIVCDFDVDETVDTRSVDVPPLIIQPFIENAIWHGILPKEGGKVSVSVTQPYDDVVQCAIEDDGIGREISMLNKSQQSGTYESKGMKLVKNRLNLFNTIHNYGGTIEVIDKKDNHARPTGTVVIIKFKKGI